MTMTEGRLGLVLVGSAEALQGVVTDGDLRRLLVQGVDLAITTVGSVASPQPLTISADRLMAEAEEKMFEARVQCLVVMASNGTVEGVVQIYQ